MTSNTVRVLAVDDNPADLRLLKEQLRDASSMDFEVVEAATLKDTLLLIPAGGFAIILLDLNLPDSIGLDGIEKILAIPAAPPVIVLTGLDNQEIGLQALSRNAQDYLVKGKFDSDMLVRSIRYAIQRDRAEKAVRRVNAELEQRVIELQAVNESLRISRIAALNITEDAVQARAAAENERRRLEAVMEALPVGVAITDQQGGSLQTNQAYARIWGKNHPQTYSVADYAPYQAWWTETGRPVVPDEWASAQAVQKGVPVIGQLIEIQRFDGSRAFVINSASPIRDADGTVVGSAVAIQEVTELRRTEQLLRKAHDELELRVRERTQELAVANRELLNEINERKEIERQLRLQTSAMEAAANGILIADLRGNIQWTNPALTRISGYDAHELLGQNTHIFKSGQQDQDFYCQMWNTVLSGQVWRGEITNRRKDGNLYMEEQTITPVRDENDQTSHFIAIKQDITERKQAEMQLEQRNMELQALSKAEREQRQLAEALADAAIILNKSLKLDEVLGHILEQIREVIPYQFSDIILLEGETFYDASHQGESIWPAHFSGSHRFPLADFPMFKKGIKTGLPVLVQDTRMEPDWVVFDGLQWSLSFLSAPLLAEEQVIGFVNLFAGQPGFFSPEMCEQLVAFAAQAAVAIQNAWLFEQVRAGNERLHSLSRRLVEIQENERRYISRELHDEAGQMLTSLMVDLRLLEKKASQPEAVKKMIAEMERSLNQVLENLHRVAMALRPASLDHLGLVAALNQHIESLGEKHALKVSFSSAKIQKRLPQNVETILYRIIQEALTNVVRHAQATRADVVLTVRDDKLIVIVEDDGIGFDSNAVRDDNHLGLFGIRERAEMINGKLVIESAPGKGTTLIVEVDLCPYD